MVSGHKKGSEFKTYPIFQYFRFKDKGCLKKDFSDNGFWEQFEKNALIP